MVLCAMAKGPYECELLHADGREEFVRVQGKTVCIVRRLQGDVVDESREEHRFGRQAEEAAKAYVWEACQRGFRQRDAPSAEPRGERAPPEMLTLYRVTGSSGTTATYLRDGRRVRSNDVIQEFESEDDAQFALERMTRPGKGDTVSEEQVSREEAGLSGLPLTDLLTHGVEHYELSESDGRAKVRFQEGTNDATAYAPLVDDLARSTCGSVHLFSEIGASPRGTWTAALGTTDLPFRNLIFDTYWETLTRQQEHSLGDLALTLARAPALERLFVSGGVHLTPLEHSSLRELYLLGDPLDASVLKALSRSTLPRLDTLVLCLGQESNEDHDALLLKSLRRLAAPALGEVYLYGVVRPLELAVPLARGMPSLRSLGVQGPLYEKELEALEEDALASLAGLEVLELDLDGCELPAPVAARLRNVRETNRDRVLPSAYERWT